MPTNPYEPAQEVGTVAVPRRRSQVLRTLLEAVGVSVAINILAWVFIALTDLSLPRLMIGIGFGLAWHANVVPAAKYLILFGVNLGLWTVIAVPVVIGMKAVYRKGKESYDAR
jgi:hypothetical protein